VSTLLRLRCSQRATEVHHRFRIRRPRALDGKANRPIAPTSSESGLRMRRVATVRGPAAFGVGDRGSAGRLRGGFSFPARC